jgi:uncharacterized damage-inducible protein DinB
VPPHLFVEPDADPRPEPPLRGGERETLLGFLRWQRATFELKCAGLEAEALARRAVEPSTLSLLGLLRHLADVERAWSRRILAGQDGPPIYRTPTDRDAAFTGAVADDAVVADAWHQWRREAEFTDRFAGQAPHLDVVGHEEWRGPVSLRWVLVHLVEEYARHNGHADLLRERIDGTVGE